MTSNRMTRAEMIQWLGDAISTETEKPFEEIDYDFVEECGCLLDELMGKAAAMSEKEIADRIEKLKPDTTSAVRKKIGSRKLWKIVVVAAVMLCMSITVVAIPELRVRLLNALKLDVGESVVEDEISYTNLGVTKYYEDIASLVSKENLDILLFEDDQGIFKITSIEHMKEISLTIITFNDPTISFHITHNENLINSKILDTSLKYSTSDFDAYLFSKDNTGTSLYDAYIYYKNDTYIIECSSDSTLSIILESLRKGD